MKRANSLLIGTLLAFSIVACQQATENTADNANMSATADVETLPPDDSAGTLNGDGNEAINEADDAGSELPSPPGTPEASMIPGQYRGSWGLVAADCEQGRSDAKGLMTIGEKSIRFYESTGTLKERRPAIATSFAGLFGFTGEGETWEKVITFTRTGDMLKRAEADGTYNYRRCT